MFRIFRLNENSNNPFISFTYKGDKITIDGDTPTKVYNSFLDWIDNQGYTFPLKVHNTKTRRVYTTDDLERMNLDYTKFHNINNKNLFLPNSSLFLGGNVELKLSNMIIMLKEFGVDTETVDSNGFKGQRTKFNKMQTTNIKKMTFINAAQLILKENGNRPMSASEIWDIIDDRDLVDTKGTTPWQTLNASMLSYSDNSNVKYKQKKKIFTIVETNPAKFKLIHNEVQDVSDEEEFEDDFSDLEQIKPFGRFPQPFDVESELRKAQAQSEDDVLSFKNFRATEPEYERPDELLVFNTYVKNPFSQAICVLGESGAGKSTTVDNILQSSDHVYQYIIPSASTTGLLSQFSPSAGAAGGYIPSRLGQMIEMAYKNKDKNYTAVFDECHKTSIIEMINDELLQAISKNRNKGVRFISLDDDTRRLFPTAQEDSRGNVLIPDNFGFIFISSNARVIAGNPDFFNRVDLVELTVEDRKLKNIEELNQKRVTSSEDKRELVNKIVSGGQ